MTYIDQFLQDLFKNLKKEGISFCILHSYENLPKYASSDIDIAIDMEQKEQLDASIARSAYNTKFLVIQKLHYDIPRCFYYVLARINAGDTVAVQLDFLIDDIGINRYCLTSNELLTGRKQYKKFYTPSHGIQAVYLLIKKTIKDRFLENHFNKLVELHIQRPSEVANTIDKYLSPQIRKEVIAAIDKKSGRRLADLIPYIDSVIKNKYSSKKFLKTLWEIRRILFRVLNPTGLLMVVLSPDGGGKSSISKATLEKLIGYFRKTAYLHWRPEGLPQLRTLLGKSKLENEFQTANPHSPKKRSSLASFFRWVYYSLDYILGYYLKILPMKIKTTAVIMDRYYYDIIVDPVRYGFNLPSWLLKSVLPIIPKPDLTLYLDNTPEGLRKRKQELPVAELKRQIETWRDFIPSLPNAHIVTTDRPLKKVVENVMQLILTKRAEMTEKMLKLNPSAAKYLWNSDCTYIALPNKKHCQWIFPASGNAFRQSWILYQPHSFKGKIYKRLLQINGLLIPGPKKLINKEVLNYREGDELRDILRKILKRKDLIMAVAKGTPSPYRKINGLIMTSEGKPLSFIKIGETEPARQRVKREVKILRRIENINFGEVQIPQCLYSGKLVNSHVLIQTIPPYKGKKGEAQLDNKHANILKILADKTAKKVPFDSSSFWKSLKEEIDNYPLSYKGLLKEGLSVLDKKTGGRKISMGLAHGDFAPWNMLWNDKVLFLYDWESAHEQAPVGIDLIHFVFQVGFLLKRLQGDRLLSYINRKSEDPYQKLSLISGIRLLEKKTLVLTYLLHMAVIEDKVQQLSRAAVERRNLIKLIIHR